jgi:hypothetical protein
MKRKGQGQNVEAYIDRAATAESELIAAIEEQEATREVLRTDSIFSDLRPVRPLPAAPILLLFCLIPALIVIAIGTKVLGLGGWEAQSWIIRVLLFGATGAALVTASYNFSRQMIPGSRRLFSAWAVELMAAGVFIATVAIAFHHKYSIDMVAADEGCFKNGVILSAVAIGLTLLTARRGVWLNRVASSLQLAALASTAALMVLTLYCPVLAASHVFVAHLGAVGVLLLSAWTIPHVVGRLVR